MHPDLLVRSRKIFKIEQLQVEPFAVRLSFGVVFLELFIRNQSAFYGIDQKHFSGFKSRLRDDLFRIKVENANFRGEDKLAVFRNVVS